jgi:hypothetical protein
VKVPLINPPWTIELFAWAKSRDLRQDLTAFLALLEL